MTGEATWADCFQRLKRRFDVSGPVTASELVVSGMCSGACLVATSDGCDCRCRGEWHGALADALVKPRWNIANTTPDSYPNNANGVVTINDLPTPYPRPWPHFPHCPECSRRLWSKVQRMPGPREDGTCPYCAAVVGLKLETS